MNDIKRLREIHVSVVIPDIVTSQFTRALDKELSEQEMHRQAEKIRQAISQLQSDYSFDIKITESYDS